jgi:hypothetical protein
MENLKSGEFWFGVWCKACKTFCPLHHDPSGGKMNIKLEGTSGPEGSTQIKTTCPHL